MMGKVSMINPFVWSFRAQFALGAAICAALLGFAMYVQFQLFIDPCPLCVLQRMVFIALGLVFLIGALHGPGGRLGRRVYGGLAAALAATGSGIAGWHVWLQMQPPSLTASCGMGWQGMVQTLPLHQAVIRAFSGSGDCAEVDWAFLGLSMPAWTLLWFLGLAFGALWAGWRRRG
jgi:protein dithiol:quinone oxidoreductase